MCFLSPSLLNSVFGASYVIDRTRLISNPIGGNYGSSSGIRVMKSSLHYDGWCGSSTLNVFMDIRSAATLATIELKPLSANPHIGFRRLSIVCNGAIVEDIDIYNRVYHMMYLCHSSENASMVVLKVLGMRIQPHMSMSTRLTTQVFLTKDNVRLLDLASAHDCFHKTHLAHWHKHHW